MYQKDRKKHQYGSRRPSQVEHQETEAEDLSAIDSEPSV